MRVHTRVNVGERWNLTSGPRVGIYMNGAITASGLFDTLATLEPATSDRIAAAEFGARISG